MDFCFQIQLELFVLLAFGSISFLVRKRLLRNPGVSFKRYLSNGLVILFIPFVVYLLALSIIHAGTYDVSNCPFHEFSGEPCTLFEYLQLPMIVDTLMGLPLYILYVLIIVTLWFMGWRRKRVVVESNLAG